MTEVIRPDIECFAGKFDEWSAFDERYADDLYSENAVSCDDTKEASIQDLPIELLDYIFSLLDVRQRIITEFVCLRWRQIGTSLPWTYPTQLTAPHSETESFPFCKAKLSDNLLSLILARCGSSLKKLKVSALCSISKDLTGQSVIRIGESCLNLEEVDISLPLDNVSLYGLAQGCTKLKIIRIYNTVWNYNYNDGMLAVVRNCLSLEKIDVTDLRIRGEWLEEINPNLKKIRITYCTLSPKAMHSLMKRCSCIQELFMVFCKPLDEDVLFKVFEHFSQTLTVLGFNHHPQHINWCKGLKLLRNLEELYLSNCNFVDDDLMDVLAGECGKLKVLDISATDVTDDGLTVLQSLPFLKELFINHTERIYGDGLKLLANRGLLEMVHLVASSNVTEESCCYLARVCPNLHYLDVTGTTQITSLLVKQVSSSLKCRVLKGPVKLIFAGSDSCSPVIISKDIKLCNGLTVVF